jgi:glucan phosphoethanolaminetransferase (alkaline phosphatase superfamily)
MQTPMMSATLSGIAALAMMGFSIAFGVLMLFMVLVQPIWCVVDCAVDNKRGTASKVIWIILLIVLYGVANWFYGAFSASGSVLRRLTRLAWALAIVLLIAFAVMFFTHADFRRGIEQEWKHRREFMVMAVDAGDVSKREQHRGL